MIVDELGTKKAKKVGRQLRQKDDTDSDDEGKTFLQEHIDFNFKAESFSEHFV